MLNRLWEFDSVLTAAAMPTVNCGLGSDLQQEKKSNNQAIKMIVFYVNNYNNNTDFHLYSLK